MTARTRKRAKPGPEVARRNREAAAQAPAGDPAGDVPRRAADRARAVSGHPARDTLYYDGQCPLCRREIDRLRAARGAAIALVDIHGLGADAPIDRDELLRSLHLRRADGQWLRGADANVSAWDGTAKARWLAALRWPLVRPLTDLGYRLWAAWRYRRRYGGAHHAARRS